MGKYELRYRVIPNCTCNDFNNELPYTLVSVDYDRKTNLIRQKGFNTWGKHNCDLFTNRKSAEKQLCELNYNIFFNKEKDQRIAELEKELAELKENAIVSRFEIGQHLYMIPTQANGLKEITKYSLLEITLSDIGVRYHLKLIHKEKGIEPYFAASEKMFNVIIFATKQEAQAKLKEIQGNE